jgi:hypothetical protein
VKVQKVQEWFERVRSKAGHGPEREREGARIARAAMFTQRGEWEGK